MPSRSGVFPLHTRTGQPTAVSLPLVSTQCHYSLIDAYALASLVQEYVCGGLDHPQNVAYVFPLRPDAAVCAFRATIDDRVVHGVVKERQRAKVEFEKAVREGKTAALLEKQHADIFQVSLGNVRPGQRVSIHISFVSIAANDSSGSQSTRLNIPVTIAPRYGTPPRLTAIHGQLAASSRLQVTVSMQMTGAIQSVTSPTHTMSVSLGSTQMTPTSGQDHDPRMAHVSFSSESFLDTDIVLIISALGLDAPRCTIESDSTDPTATTEALALTLVPKFNIPPLPKQGLLRSFF